MNTSGIKAFAPATISNILCSFNRIAVALEQAGIEAIVSRGTSPDLNISVNGNAYNKKDKSKITSVVEAAVNKYFEWSKIKREHINIDIKGRISLGSETGILEAAAAASIFAIDSYFKNNISKNELFTMLQDLNSQLISVTNLAACIFGGFQLITVSHEKFSNHRIPCPPGLTFALNIPEIEMQKNTIDTTIFSIEDIQNQTSSIAGFILGMSSSNLDLIKQSLNDYLIEKQIKDQIPNFDKIKELIVPRETLGIGIAGKGPTLFALTANSVQAEEIGLNIQTILLKKKVDSLIIITKINSEGVYIC